MTVEHLEAEAPTAGSDSLFVFVNMLPIPGSPGTFGGWSNECASVELSGESFTLTAAQRSSVIASAGDAGVFFRPFRTIARFAERATPHYWVAPLLNFVVDFRRLALPLQDHPLRTRATAPLAASDGRLGLFHESFYREGNALIPFLCEGEPAFVEPLSDYTQRRARVESGESVVTAVAVGRTPDGFDLDAWDWFPSDLVTLLGLSSGRAVGVPVVDIRGAAGQLIATRSGRSSSAGPEGSTQPPPPPRGTGPTPFDVLTAKEQSKIMAADGLYELLEVERTASAAEIRRAYRARAKEFHPDAGGSVQEMMALNAARERS
jgi:hypothetical protein